MRVWSGIGGIALMIASSAALAVETPMQHTVPRAAETPRDQAETPREDAESAGDRLRAVLGRPVECPPGQAIRSPETGV